MRVITPACLLVTLFLTLVSSSLAKQPTALECYQAKDQACLEQLEPKMASDKSQVQASDYDPYYYLGLLALEEDKDPAAAKRFLMIATTFGKGHQPSRDKLTELLQQGVIELDAAECAMLKINDCLIRLAEEKNDSAAQFLLGSRLINTKPEQAAIYLQQASDQGHRTAPCVLADAAMNEKVPSKQSYHELVQQLRENCIGLQPYKKLSKKSFDKFVGKADHKALAYSDSGAWHTHHGYTSSEVAARAALEFCQARNRQKDKPCRVINVDGIWVKDFMPPELPDLKASESGLLTHKARKSFKKFESEESNKVFAQSAMGAWSWYSSSSDSLEELTDKALRRCRSNGGKLKDQYPCKVVNINGDWQP